MNHVSELVGRAADGSAGSSARAKSVIFIFLSGVINLSTKADPKPEAPDGIRGEFSPIANGDAGTFILRAPANAGGSQQQVGNPAIADDALITDIRKGTCPCCLVERCCRRRSAPKLMLEDRPSTRRQVLPARKQPAAGNRAARKADSSHNASHPRPVRRPDGFPPRSLVPGSVTV